jgi:c-di-GMP-binding flagellar brake protein YcgR
VNQNVEVGQIIHTKFLLSKYPLVFMDIFGEVVRSAPSREKDEDTWQLGIRFLDMSLNDREKIISSVFQKQRVELRKKGRMADSSDE